MHDSVEVVDEQISEGEKDRLSERSEHHCKPVMDGGKEDPTDGACTSHMEALRQAKDDSVCLERFLHANCENVAWAHRPCAESHRQGMA